MSVRSIQFARILTQMLLWRQMLFLFLLVISVLGLFTALSILYLGQTQKFMSHIIENHQQLFYYSIANKNANENTTEIPAVSRESILSTTITQEIEGAFYEEDLRVKIHNSLNKEVSFMLKRLEEGFLATVPSLSVPSVYYFLPHLLDSTRSLRPEYCLSKGRSGVSVVMGIPTHRREVNKLMKTIKDLLENMTPEEEADTVIVVFVAETLRRHVIHVSKQILILFPKQVKTGLLEVVSPPVAYYPKTNASRSRHTWQDAPDQERKQIKTTLDTCFLMMYAQPKGKFYVQLQNDIVSRKNFISIMKKYAHQKSSENPFWLVLEFSRFGILGAMFKTADLPLLIQFFFTFYSDQPLERLLHYFVTTKTCRSNTDCKSAKFQFCFQYTPTLFRNRTIYDNSSSEMYSINNETNVYSLC